MIDKIHHYSLTNPASVYDEEGMTALELAGRTAAKVNECVEKVNEIPDVVSKDVNDHIKNGDFDKQISDYAGELDKRVNVILGGLPANPTNMDAEVIDIRNGAYGVEYPNAGEAVRDQFERSLLMRGLIDSVSEMPTVDDVRDPCVYLLHFGEGTTSIPAGLPFEKWEGRIAALFTLKHLYHRQILINDKHIYTRNASVAGAWSEWTVLNDLPQHGSAEDTTYLSVLPDANDAKNGFYSLHFAADTYNMTANLPWYRWGKGKVATLLTTENNYKRQLFFCERFVYTRYCANGKWSNWVNLMGKNEIVIDINGGGDYTSILKALIDNPDDTRFIVKSGTYDIWNEYVSHSPSFFTNYSGYAGHSVTYRGLPLGNGCELIGEGNVKLYFENRLTSNPAIAQYFSILNPTQNNVVENIDIEIKDDSCRYLIHDDFATEAGVNVFRNMHLKGYSHLGTAIGGGFGTKNTYVIERCTFEGIGESIAIAYHNNVGNGQSRLYINGCYCEGSIILKHYGVSTKKSTALISGTQCTRVTLTHADAVNYPNENVKVFEVKSGSDVDPATVNELTEKVTALEEKVAELESKIPDEPEYEWMYLSEVRSSGRYVFAVMQNGVIVSGITEQDVSLDGMGELFYLYDTGLYYEGEECYIPIYCVENENLEYTLDEEGARYDPPDDSGIYADVSGYVVVCAKI